MNIQYEALVIVAPPKVLGNLREALHSEVIDRITAEVSRELTSHTVPDIQRLLAV